MLKTAIIGITGYGAEHLRLLLDGYNKGLMKPCAAVVINPEDVPERIEELESLGCRIYASVESMWAEEKGQIDLCMIPSSIGTHFPFAKMALENGSHVFLEKPVCGTIQEAETLSRLAARLGLEVCVGFQDLYSRDAKEVKRRILNGDIGKIRAVKGWGSWPRPSSYYERNSWAGRLKDNGTWVLDSPVNNAMAHFLMILLFWSGRTEDSYGQLKSIQADLHRAQDIESFDTASLKIGLEEGHEIFYGVTHSGEKNAQVFLTVEGEEGSIEWEHFSQIRINTPAGTEIIGFENLDSLREGMIEQVCEWIHYRSGKVVHVPEACLLTKVVNALHQSFPVREFRREQILQKEISGAVFRLVPGLVDDLRDAFESSLLLSELRPETYGPVPQIVSLADYKTFDGICKLPSMAAL